MKYRLYQAEDFLALYAIEEACFQPPHRFSRRYMRQLLAAPRCAAWIAEQDGVLCGFGILDWTESQSGGSAYVQTLELLPFCRGRGVGAELLGRMEQSARDAGAATVCLHVDAENAAAIKLYECSGYALTIKVADYYGSGRAGLVYLKKVPVEPSIAGQEKVPGVE